LSNIVASRPGTKASTPLPFSQLEDSHPSIQP
jgi:hypothetical protein